MYFHIFVSSCYILVDREARRKWNSKSDDGIFLGYSINSRVFRVYNKCTQCVMESTDVVINDGDNDFAPVNDDDGVVPNVSQNVLNMSCDINHFVNVTMKFLFKRRSK